MPPTLDNAGFEDPVETDIKYAPSQITVPNWTYGPGEADGGIAPATYDGAHPTQWAFLNVPGTVTQTFTATAGTYTLGFAAKASSGSDSVDVVIDGVTAQTIALTGSFAAYTTDPIALSAGSHTLRFAHSTGSGYVAVDDVEWTGGGSPTPAGRVCAFDGSAGLVL